MRIFTEIEVNAIYTTLVARAGAREANRADFVHSVMPRRGSTYGVSEYRFQGLLGFGGKFRNNGNNNDSPHIDYYPEDRNDARDAIVNDVNKILQTMFKDRETA